MNSFNTYAFAYFGASGFTFSFYVHYSMLLLHGTGRTVHP